MATRPTTTNGILAIELAGRLAATLRSLQLPGYRVEQVVVPTGPNASARLGANVDITALDAVFNVTQSDALTDWALSLPRGKGTQPIDGAALVLDGNNRLARRVEWTQGLVTALRLPELDASSKAAFSLALTWLPSTVTYAKTAGAVVVLPPLGKARKTPLLSNFRVQGLPFDGQFVSRVTLPTVTATLATLSTQRPGYAQVDLGEVQLVMSARSREAVLAWVQNAVADGQIADKEYLSLNIELLDPALKKVLLTVQLSGCALLGYEESRLDTAHDTLGTVALRLAVGKLDLVFSPV